MATLKAGLAGKKRLCREQKEEKTSSFFRDIASTAASCSKFKNNALKVLPA